MERAAFIQEVAGNSRLQLAAAKFGECHNPICRKRIEPLPGGTAKTWRRTARKYCCDKCRQSGWILARAAKILFQLEPAEWFAILDAVRVKTAVPKTSANGRGKRAVG